MKDPALLAYCEALEREFFRLKGRPGTLSPPDFARASAWYESGIPLGPALEGIREAFRAQGAGRDREAEEVNSLAYCESFVEAAARRSSG
jgi:hypothetical protein